VVVGDGKVGRRWWSDLTWSFSPVPPVIGRKVGMKAAELLKPAVLEMGGNTP